MSFSNVDRNDPEPEKGGWLGNLGWIVIIALVSWYQGYGIEQWAEWLGQAFVVFVIASPFVLLWHMNRAPKSKKRQGPRHW